jgi:hypothetical protein
MNKDYIYWSTIIVAIIVIVTLAIFLVNSNKKNKNCDKVVNSKKSQINNMSQQHNSTLSQLNNTKMMLAQAKASNVETPKLFSINVSTKLFSNLMNSAVDSMKDPTYLNTINSYLAPTNKSEPIEYVVNVTNSGTFLDHICSDCGTADDLRWTCAGNTCTLQQVNNWNDATGFGHVFKSCGDNANQNDDRCGNGKCCCEYGYKKNPNSNDCTKCYTKDNCELYSSSMLDAGLVGFRIDLGSLKNITVQTNNNLLDIKLSNIKGYIVIVTSVLSTDPGCSINMDVELKAGVTTQMSKAANGEYTLKISPNISSVKVSNVNLNNCGSLLNTAGDLADKLSDTLSSKLSGVIKSSLEPMLSQTVSNLPPGIISQLTTEIKNNSINIYSV